MSPELKLLSAQEWENLIDDYNHGGSRRLRWTTTNYAAVPLLELSLSTLLRKDLPHNLKIHLLIFIEEHLNGIVTQSSVIIRLIEVLRSIIQSPNDGVSSSFALKEQVMITATSIFVNSVFCDSNVVVSADFVSPLEMLIELLLSVVNRPNHSVDRQVRVIGCECLRELEIACPCLLSEIGVHLWSLCQNERTHSCQSYALLLATVVNNVATLKCNVSFSSSAMLVPFSVPRFLVDESVKDGFFLGGELSDLSNRELRRVVAFLLECTQNLTPWGLLEFMDKVLPVAGVLDLQPSLLKVQFSGLLYTYDPLLWHAYLVMYLSYMESFEGQEMEIASRLLLLSKESQHHLFFRLLVLHWLVGFIGLVLKRDFEKRKNVVDMSLSFYPSVFDPLALKSLKLDLLSYCSVLIDDVNGVGMSSKGSPQITREKLFEDGLVCVSAFKWLPSWSMETSVAFRAIHKFLIGQTSHKENDSISNKIHLEPAIYPTVQRTLIDSLSEHRGLVPVIVGFTDRLLTCSKHRFLGERLLKTFDDNLLPKLKIDYKLVSYFSILERIAESDKVSPSGLIELLTRFMLVLVEKHGPDTGLRSWSHGSKVLGICRTMIMHQYSSKLFVGLSRLLSFTCLYFPDLEIRDNARIYLRMLICVPGKKLRDILNSGDQLPGISPSTHSSSFFSIQSPRISHDPKKSKSISSCMHLERMVPLLVKQSWSLSLPALGLDAKKPSYIEPIKDNMSPSEQSEFDKITDDTVISEVNRHDQPPEPLRVMDSKISQIVEILRKHFSLIPDFRHMPGLKIKIPCALRFESEPFSRIWGINMPANGVDTLPALYATVLKLSSSAPYGSIPSCHIPFLLGQPPKGFYSFSQTNSLDIIPVEDVSETPGDDKRFKAPVVIELEPRDPIPGFVDVSIETNADNGQLIRGQLHNITVGIEDMFLRAIVPEDIPVDTVRGYYVDLFNALWEACGASTSTGRETFVLKGGKGVTAISGTRSVKLLEVPVASLIQAVERSLAPFVVCVTGYPLTKLVKEGGVIRDIALDEMNSSSSSTDDEGVIVGGPLYLKYNDDEDEGGGNYVQISKKNLGTIQILIFLPPRFHLLFQMEVSDTSTLVRIRTDHWPCLAYVDDYLEALFC
ncbi:putative ADP-ribosylation factor GTPase-activating protein AGD4-like [Capsicum annuum]|nr:putative ADP-ribosylation factor GTPase-activating protein AGD4-like [Capsicum annuum]